MNKDVQRAYDIVGRMYNGLEVGSKHVRSLPEQIAYRLILNAMTMAYNQLDEALKVHKLDDILDGTNVHVKSMEHIVLDRELIYELLLQCEKHMQGSGVIHLTEMAGELRADIEHAGGATVQVINVPSLTINNKKK